MKKLLFLGSLLVLSNCAGTKPQIQVETKYVQWNWPTALQSCASDPVVINKPKITTGDVHAASKIAAYVVNLQANDTTVYGVADDCRSTLQAAVAAWKAANISSTSSK